MNDASHEPRQGPGGDSAHSYYFEIFIVALASLLLEVCYTRVFSFKLFYFYTYLIIGVALLGLGAGGVAVTSLKRIRETALTRLVPVCSLLAGLTTGLGYAAVAWLDPAIRAWRRSAFHSAKSWCAPSTRRRPGARRARPSGC